MFKCSRWLEILISVCYRFIEIFDFFLFNNELDLLKIRVGALDSIVDQFLVVETSVNFNGVPKEKSWGEIILSVSPKIEYILIEESAYEVCNNVSKRALNWCRESLSRNELARFEHLVADEDLVLLSDPDEIPDRSCIEEYIPKGIIQLVVRI